MDSFSLTAASGPACPRCGCRETDVLQPPDPGGGWFANGRAVCNHCGAVFPVGNDPPPADGQPAAPATIVRPRIRCPRCKSPNIRTHTTRPQKDDEGDRVSDGWVVRYHQCLECRSRGLPPDEYNFKSVER